MEEQVFRYAKKGLRIAGNRARFVQGRDILCNSCYLFKAPPDFRAARVGISKAQCKKCHSEQTYAIAVRKAASERPESYTDCETCDRTFSLFLKSCPGCGADPSPARAVEY